MAHDHRFDPPLEDPYEALETIYRDEERRRMTTTTKAVEVTVEHRGLDDDDHFYSFSAKASAERASEHDLDPGESYRVRITKLVETTSTPTAELITTAAGYELRLLLDGDVIAAASGLFAGAPDLKAERAPAKPEVVFSDALEVLLLRVRALDPTLADDIEAEVADRYGDVF